jgi:peptide deformylase
MVLKIRQAGEPVLRQQARPLTRKEILSPSLQELIALMRDTMRDAPGVGLAAPQIGLPLQLAVIEDRQEYIDKLPAGHAEERGRKAVRFQVIFNPVITLGAEQAPFFEGCLSIAGFSAVVPRALSVRVECLNERAEPVVIEAEGWYARILQHEIDHLHGSLYIDRMDSRTFTTAENFTRHGNRISRKDS